MAFKKTTLLLILSVLLSQLLAANVANARELMILDPTSITKMAARLEAKESGGMVECWNALYELKSCTNEIITFLMNGETKLGPACCGAVNVVTNNCWPAMLTSLGFTAEEGNDLLGYCNSSDPSPSPAAAPTNLASSVPAPSPLL